MRIATIDLGTNTCHLLIAELKNNSYDRIFQETQAVKLGEGGITENRIADAGIERAVKTFKNYHALCTDHEVNKIFATATAAVRQAKNKNDLIKQIEAATGINLNVIDGNKEATLIYHGIKMALPKESHSALMMDIGGGSVEFIITKNGSIMWQKSFATGAALLLEKFNPSDPITKDEIETIKKFLNKEWEELFSEIKKYRISNFIGASGSFQTICDLHLQKLNSVDISYLLSIDGYKKVSNLLIGSNRKCRLGLAGMKSMRVDMIVLAIIMITLVLDKTESKTISYSNFALKEGLCNLLFLDPKNELISTLTYYKP